MLDDVSLFAATFVVSGLELLSFVDLSLLCRMVVMHVAISSSVDTDVGNCSLLFVPYLVGGRLLVLLFSKSGALLTGEKFGLPCLGDFEAGGRE